MLPSISRRRAIGITAAAAGLGLVPLAGAARTEAHLVTWRGQVMGASATLQLHHHDRAAAERLVAQALAEVRRLERVFSLYRDDSALVALNRRGVLVAPPQELVALLTECRRYWELTGGAFDPTVQVLWALYRDHFSRPGADPGGPSGAALKAALARVGFGDVVFDADRIAFARRGMALTLNGIAQGFVTDRVVEMLRREGIARSLVDMGETRALGARPDGDPWRVGIANPREPLRIGATLEIADEAVATSGGYGFRFDPQGRITHLFDPQTGTSPHLHASVTVVMPTATEADALSTAFALLPRAGIERLLRRLGHGRAHLATAAGESAVLGAT